MSEVCTEVCVICCKKCSWEQKRLNDPGCCQVGLEQHAWYILLGDCQYILFGWGFANKLYNNFVPSGYAVYGAQAFYASQTSFTSVTQLTHEKTVYFSTCWSALHGAVVTGMFSVFKDFSRLGSFLFRFPKTKTRAKLNGVRATKLTSFKICQLARNKKPAFLQLRTHCFKNNYEFWVVNMPQLSLCCPRMESVDKYCNTFSINFWIFSTYSHRNCFGIFLCGSWHYYLF